MVRPANRGTSPRDEAQVQYNERDDYAIIFSDEINQSNIDYRQKPALLCSIRKTEKNVIYVTSLYHVKLARSESPVEKLFAAGMAVREIMAKYGIEAQPLLQIDLSKFIPPEDIARIKSITATVLADPEVKDYMIATILKNRDPTYIKWLTASEERRNDWKFRANSGDVALFREHNIHCWLSLASPIIALPKSQRWGID
jgi:hypothetical protein